MSGNQIGSVIGAAIGALLAPTTGGMSLVWASRGMSIGGMIGGMLMPDEVGIQDQNGPRLSDLKITSATYGAAINRVYGAYRIGGNIIYSSDIKETKHTREEEVGKGGSESYEVITYTYSVDMAIAFCEGEVQAIKRIWADSLLIYDVNQGGFTSEFKSSDEKSGEIRFYLGSPTQEIDWFLQSQEPDTPAYRNICYIRFKDFQLQKFGNRIPNITCEVVQSGSNNSTPLSTIKTEYHWQGFSTIFNVKNNVINTLSAYFTNTYENIHFRRASTSNSAEAFIDWGKFYYPTKQCSSGPPAVSCNHGYWVAAGASYDNSFLLYKWDRNYMYKVSDDGIDCCSDTIIELPYSIRWRDRNHLFYYIVSNSTIYLCLFEHKIIYKIVNNSIIQEVEMKYGRDHNTESAYYNGFLYLIHRIDDNILNFVKYDNNLNIISDDTVVTSINFSAAVGRTGFYAVDFRGHHIFHYDNYERLDYEFNTEYVTTNFSMYVQTRDTTGAFYFNNGILYKLYESKSSGDNFLYSYIAREYVYGLDANEIQLSVILESLLLKAGLTNDQFYLGELNSVSTYGFNIDNVSSVRSAIAILQSTFLFDLIEEDFMIVAKLRNNTTNKTIIKNDLIDGKYSIESKLETELPKKITVKYANKDKDYLVGSQSSLRTDSKTDNNNEIDLPIVMSDSEAKQLSEKLLFLSYSSKKKINVNIPIDTSISLSDVISIYIDDVVLKARVISITYNNYSMEICLLSEDSTVYESNAIGSSTTDGFEQSEIANDSPTLLNLLNAPTLDNSAINSLGVYYTVQKLDSSWKGASILKSKNGGQTYNNVNASLVSGSFGRCKTTLPDGITTTLDLDSSLRVRTLNNKFNNITYSDLINGKNYIIVGDEVLQYMNFVDEGDDEYTLSLFLRGRRGTEWATNLHVDEESFTLLDFESVLFDFSTINADRKYKAVTFGGYVDDAIEYSHTYYGTNLKPFSVFDMTLDLYEQNGDLLIKWMRRDRYISGYMRSLPLSESQEQYHLEIYDLSLALIRDEYISDNTEFNYTTGLRLLDGLLGTNEDTFHYKISQVSSEVGDGYKTEGIKSSENI